MSQVILISPFSWNWHGLTVIPPVTTLYSILPAYFPVYPQGHLVAGLPILSSGKFFLHPLTMCLTVSLASLHNPHSGVSEVLSILYLVKFVLEACSWAARIKSYVSFFKNPFLNHLQDSFPASSGTVQTLRVGLSRSIFELSLQFSSSPSHSPAGSLLQQ